MTLEQATHILVVSIRNVIRDCKADGTAGMSLANLKQITPTRGLTCHPAIYHQAFEKAAKLAAKGFVTD